MNQSEHSQTYNITCAPSKDSDQHNCTLIRGVYIGLMQFIIAA